MDENFIIELCEEGEKKFGFEVPLAMPFVEALNAIKGTLGEVIQASGGWKDQDNLKTLIALEAEGWLGIFAKAMQVAEASGSAMVDTLGESGNAQKLIGLANSGNQVMKHFYISGEEGSDVLKMYFAFRKSPGIKMETSIDFG